MAGLTEAFGYHRVIYEPAEADVCCESNFITVCDLVLPFSLSGHSGLPRMVGHWRHTGDVSGQPPPECSQLGCECAKRH
jgi:hypothetical protein